MSCCRPQWEKIISHRLISLEFFKIRPFQLTIFFHKHYYKLFNNINSDHKTQGSPTSNTQPFLTPYEFLSKSKVERDISRFLMHPTYVLLFRPFLKDKKRLFFQEVVLGIFWDKILSSFQYEKERICFKEFSQASVGEKRGNLDFTLKQILLLKKSQIALYPNETCKRTVLCSQVS